MEDIVNFENELTRNDEPDAANKPAQKPKRGRKMTMTTKDNDAMCTTIEESTTILSENSQSPLNENWQKQSDGSMRKNSLKKQQMDKTKKQRGRKSGTSTPRQDAINKAGSGGESKNSATTSASDEDEECSAHNCARPQGNFIFFFISLINFELEIIVRFFFRCCCFWVGREVDWVQCDGGCNEWFHMFCVGLIKSQIKPDDDFICKKCKKVPVVTSTNTQNDTNTQSSSTTTSTETTTTTTTTPAPTTNNGSFTKKRLTRSKDESLSVAVTSSVTSNDE